MSHDQLTYDDLLRIVELIKTSEQFSEFRLKIGEIEVELRRRGAGAPVPAAAAHAPAAAVPAAKDPMPSAVTQAAPTPAAAPAHAAAARARAELPEGAIVIRAPMVGTFYRAPEPGARPFVSVGQVVDPDTTVCIIEVMKLMNSIPAGAHGVVTHVFVDDAAPVEAGQALIALNPQPGTR
ncbi:MAG TPA: acetyl-CoA carboxylase biotin carboxyl carrier protein [Casimicrobiaceae bacterium]|nr:acetyl-CoA carboxylase biotin carboxyl carrier protein [Casimicrobiaceae bacterium]